MNKNGKQTTTRHSTTLIQSKVVLADMSKPTLTRSLLQYKWLKPQISAFHLHHFQQTCKQFKIKNIKDAYINSLQSVNINPVLLKKYYRMQEIHKQIKKNIASILKYEKPRPYLLSPLYQLIRYKYKKIARQQQINFFRQKINPKHINHSKESQSKHTKSKTKLFTFNKVGHKRPSKSKKKSSYQENHSKTKLNNTKIEAIKIVDSHEENYGLKCYHVKNKLSLHNLNACDKSVQKVNQRPLHEYKQSCYYINSSRPKHKKTNSNATPQKSIQTSRKVSSKQSLYLRSQKIKTQSSRQKNRLHFSKKHKY